MEINQIIEIILFLTIVYQVFIYPFYTNLPRFVQASYKLPIS